MKYIFWLYCSADWYKGRLTEQQLAELENPPTPRPKATKGAGRRKHRPQGRSEETED